jgi:hypothetical protein
LKQSEAVLRLPGILASDTGRFRPGSVRRNLPGLFQQILDSRLGKKSYKIFYLSALLFCPYFSMNFIDSRFEPESSNLGNI